MKHFVFKYAVLGMFGIVILVPNLAFAGPVVRTGKTVSIDANQIIESDFYGLGNSVIVSGESSHDAYIAGGSVTMNAPVRGDLSILGGNVQVHAEIDDDVRIVGNTVILAEPIKGDLVVLGGSVTVLSTAHVSGDVLFFAGNATIAGAVDGSVVGTADEVRIDGPVLGDVRVRGVSGVALGERAVIGGDVAYTSNNELVRAPGASISGEVRKGAIEKEQAPRAFRTIVLQLLITLFTTLTAFLMLKPFITRILTDTSISYGLSGITGLLVFIATPFISALLMASVIGLVVGGMLLLGYLLLIIASWVIACILLGVLLTKTLFKRKDVTLGAVVLGTVFFNLLIAIPLVGPIIGVALMLIAFGTMLVFGYRVLRR